MAPTLPEGSAILVDRARRWRRVGGIFVVRTADGVVVKRAGKDEAGGWLLQGVHPAWEPALWPDDAEVIGEVKWMARTLSVGVGDAHASITISHTVRLARPTATGTPRGGCDQPVGSCSVA